MSRGKGGKGQCKGGPGTPLWRGPNLLSWALDSRLYMRVSVCRSVHRSVGPSFGLFEMQIFGPPKKGEIE